MNKQTFIEDGFLINDPEKHPGVILDVPAGVDALQLEPVGYSSDTEVRCSFCPQRQKHRRGFFAVLPDGSLALCGNCCAEKIAGKATVAKIKRDVKRCEDVAAARKDVALLAVGLDLVIEILERDWLLVEKDIHRHVRRLNECFYSVKAPGMAKLTVVAAGLRDISAASSGRPVSLSAIKRRRSRALNMIQEGLSELRDEVAKFELDGVRQLVDRDDPIHGFCRTKLHGRLLYVLDCPPWCDPELHDGHMKVRMTIPKLHIPDRRPLMEAVEVATLAAG